MKNLNSKSIPQLRKIAVSLGADKSSIRGMDKEALIEAINSIHANWLSKPESQKLVKEVEAYIAANFQPSM